MPIKTIDKQRLDSLYAEYHGRYEGRKEDYFALLYMTRKFKVDEEEVAHQVAFGGNDYGIDAYFIDRDARNLYLHQFRWSEDHGQFKGSMERLTKDGLARIFGNPNQDAGQNDLNDKKLPIYLEEYGSSLVKEAMFGEILKQLTGNRVTPILRELMGSAVYQEKVAQEKYDFLRTTEAFKKAMAIASDKYNWSKKSF